VIYAILCNSRNLKTILGIGIENEIQSKNVNAVLANVKERREMRYVVKYKLNNQYYLGKHILHKL
jgi:hypothetical protein